MYEKKKELKFSGSRNDDDKQKKNELCMLSLSLPCKTWTLSAVSNDGGEVMEKNDAIMRSDVPNNDYFQRHWLHQGKQQFFVMPY